MFIQMNNLSYASISYKCIKRLMIDDSYIPDLHRVLTFGSYVCNVTSFIPIIVTKTKEKICPYDIYASQLLKSIITYNSLAIVTWCCFRRNTSLKEMLYKEARKASKVRL